MSQSEFPDREEEGNAGAAVLREIAKEAEEGEGGGRTRTMAHMTIQNSICREKASPLIGGAFCSSRM